MDTDSFRKIIADRLYKALFESNYEVWVSPLPEPVENPYACSKDKVARFFVKNLDGLWIIAGHSRPTI